VIIDRAAHDAMIEHMRQADPLEGVGLLAGVRREPCPRDTNGDGDCGQQLCPNCAPARVPRCERWVPLVNAAEHPRLRFQVDPAEQIAAYRACAPDGLWPLIMVHSHVRASAAPSETDIRYATDPNLLHMIVSLAGVVPVATLWRLDPTAVGVARCRRVRYEVADLGFRPYPATDLTHGVTDA
jgi:proteasome lid subunit RPN8/RPN11